VEVGERRVLDADRDDLVVDPFSSRIRITPTARASTIVSGNTGSCPSTSASSGSPSSQ
jgi:hypothetical protein